MAEVELRSALTAFADIFPPEAPKPTLEEFTDRWASRLARMDSGDGVGIFVAIDRTAGGAVVGQVMADPDPETGPGTIAHGNLRALYIEPNRWGLGVGRRLHATAREFLRVSRPLMHTIDLWVMERNATARARYEDWGWQLTIDRQEIWPGVDELRYEAKQ